MDAARSSSSSSPSPWAGVQQQQQQQQLAGLDREPYTAEGARKVVLTLAELGPLRAQPELLPRIRALILAWLARGESEWLQAMSTAQLFDLTLEVARQPGGSRNFKQVKEKVVRSFLAHLKVSRNPVAWLRWFRACLGRGDLALADIKPQFDAVLQAFALVLRGASTGPVASSSSSSRTPSTAQHTNSSKPSSKKALEWWSSHATTCVEVCETLTRSPDGLGTLCLTQPDICGKYLASSLLHDAARVQQQQQQQQQPQRPNHQHQHHLRAHRGGASSPESFAPASSPPLASVVVGPAILLPGDFALLVSRCLVVAVVGQQDQQQQQHDPWMSDSALTAFEDKSLAEMEAWMIVFAWTLRSCANKNKLTTATLAKSFPALLAGLRAYSIVLAREFPSPRAVRKNAPHPEGLIAVLQALRSVPDMIVVAESLQHVGGRHVLFELDSVADTFYAVVSGLAEVGIPLMCEQLVRHGTLLATHSFSLAEGDALESMVLRDLRWTAASPLSPKTFQDGRLVLRICQACVWPRICPGLARELVEFVDTVRHPRQTPALQGNWLAVENVLDTRLGKNRNTARSTSERERLLRKLLRNPESSSSSSSSSWAALNIPTFAKRAGTGGGVQADPFRAVRARRFCDAVLGVLSSDLSTPGGEGTWIEDVDELFMEAFLERNEDEGGGEDMDDDEEQYHHVDNVPQLERAFHTWLGVWGARSLAIGTLKSRFGSAKDTFETIERQLERMADANEGPRFPRSAKSFLVDFLWSLRRELLVFAPVNPDPRVAAFFTKNAETCQSWLLRLGELANRVERTIRTSPPLGLVFHFLNHERRGVNDSVPVVETLALRQEPGMVRALASRSDAFFTPLTVAYMEAMEDFARGAYWRARVRFQHAMQIHAKDVEKNNDRNVDDDDDDNEGGVVDLLDSDGNVARSCRDFAVQCSMRLCDWTEAKRQYAGIEDLDFSAVVDRRRIARMVELFGSVGGDGDGEDWRKNAILHAVSGNDGDDGDDPVLAFGRWLVNPSSPRSVSELKRAVSSAKPVMRGVTELTRFAFGETGRADEDCLSGSPRATEVTGELWSVLQVAARQYPHPGFSSPLLARDLLCNALEAKDLDTVRVVLGKAEDSSVDVDVAIQLVQQNVLSRSNVEVLLPPRDGLERSVFDLATGKLETAANGEAALARLAATTTTTHPHPHHPLAARYLFELAGWARSRGNTTLSARLHHRCIELDSARAYSNAAVILFLQETDAESGSAALEHLPCPVLVKALPHLYARANGARALERFGAALGKLAEECPREVVWGVVAESRGNALMDATRQRLDVGLYEEAERLKRGLVDASRTWDEDWDDFLNDLGKHSWIARLFAMGGGEDDAVWSPIRNHARALWEETLGFAGGMPSAYHAQFAASKAGAAIRSWVGSVWSAEAFDEAKGELAEWFAQQGTRRVSKDLSWLLARDKVFRVVPDGGDETFQMDARVDVLRTKTRPRRIGFRAVSSSSCSRVKHFLLKSAEDLRLDQRLVQLWSLVAGENVRSYVVVPLSRRVGLIQWVDRAVPLFHAYREWKDSMVTGAGAGSSVMAMTTTWRSDEDETPTAVLLAATGDRQTLEVAKGERMEAMEQFHRALVKAGQDDKLSAFREMRSRIDQRLLGRFLANSSTDVQAWWAKSRRYTKSCGVGSMLGWMVGLGDRHLDNVLLDVDTGDVIHVDLNVCFDKGAKLRVPETVPFRLTGIMTGAMPFCEGETRVALERGAFGEACAWSLRVMHEKREVIMAFLEAFVFDPIRPQRSFQHRVALNLNRTEFESFRLVFLADARRWMDDPAVGEAGDDYFPDVVDAPDENPRKALEKARSGAHRAQAECARQRERATGAHARVLGCDRLLNRKESSPDSRDDALSPPMKRVLVQLGHAEALCGNILGSSLGRWIAAIRTFPTVSKLRLPCSQWHDRLSDALKRVAQNEPCARFIPPHEEDEDENEGTSTSSLRRPLPAWGIQPTDMQNIAEFRIVVQSLVDASGFAEVMLQEQQMQKPGHAHIVQRMERTHKYVMEVMLLADSVTSLVNDARDECAGARLAYDTLRRAYSVVRGAASRPARLAACERVPDCADFYNLCLQARKDCSALAQYVSFCAKTRPIQPRHIPKLRALLGQCVVQVERGEDEKQGEEEEVVVDDDDEEQGGEEDLGKAEYQARQANVRVQNRLDLASAPHSVVGELLAQATDERNLSGMFSGWMAWI